MLPSFYTMPRLFKKLTKQPKKHFECQNIHQTFKITIFLRCQKHFKNFFFKIAPPKIFFFDFFSKIADKFFLKYHTELNFGSNLDAEQLKGTVLSYSLHLWKQNCKKIKNKNFRVKKRKTIWRPFVLPCRLGRIAPGWHVFWN
jgi:hypothetical protein